MKSFEERDFIIIGLFIIIFILLILLWGLNEGYGTLARLYIENCQITQKTIYYNLTGGVLNQ